jgi:nitrate reductase gamma subunit
VSSSLARFYLRPEGYLFVKIWGDSFGLLLLLGLGMGSIRRFMLPEARETSNQMDIILLVLLLSITLSGFALEGLRLTIMPAEIARYSYVGHFFSPPGMRAVEQLRPWLTACWILHFSLVVALIAYVPHSKLMHSILAPVIIGMNAAEENKRGDLYWPDKKKYREARSPRG